MATVSVEVPDEVVRLSEQSPEEFAQAMRLAAAMFWYQREGMSMARAAELAGMHRAEFMMALADAKIDTVAVDITKALGLLQRFVVQETELRSLVAIPRRDNIASCSIARKCGFVESGVAREDPVNGVVFHWTVPGHACTGGHLP